MLCIIESISDSAYCDRCIRALSVCLSVTLVNPAKAVGQNEMPFRRDAISLVGLWYEVTLLDRGPGPPLEGEV